MLDGSGYSDQSVRGENQEELDTLRPAVPHSSYRTDRAFHGSRVYLISADDGAQLDR